VFQCLGLRNRIYTCAAYCKCPISLICVSIESIQRIINVIQMLEYLHNHNFLNESQHGFLKGAFKYIK
jgi:hypothetical protein